MNTDTAILNHGLSDEHFAKLLTLSTSDIERFRYYNETAANDYFARGDRTNAKAALAVVRTAQAVLNARTATASQSTCSHTDHDAEGRCYSCGERAARSVASYL